MKKGVIVYITGEEPENLTNHPKNMLKKLDITADRLEFISDRSGHFDVHTAAWNLTASGAQQIYCLTAEFADTDNLKLTGREMRLCG